MRRSQVCRLVLVAALALGALSPPTAPPAQAQFGGGIVFDPQNYAQNLLTAARTLQQIQNQIAQLEQQARMLAANGLQLSPELSAAIAEAQALFQTAQGIAYDIRQVGEDLRALYPETWEDFDLDGVLEQSDRWLQQSRRSLETAMQAQARAAQSLEQSRGRIATALGSSVAAPGQTAAVQAGNQLLGVSATELAEIRALLVAQGRALSIERMERARFQAKWDPVRRPESAPRKQIASNRAKGPTMQSRGKTAPGKSSAAPSPTLRPRRRRRRARPSERGARWIPLSSPGFWISSSASLIRALA